MALPAKVSPTTSRRLSMNYYYYWPIEDYLRGLTPPILLPPVLVVFVEEYVPIIYLFIYIY